MSGTGQTKGERSQLQMNKGLKAERLTMHSLHAVVAVPHSKCSLSERCSGRWFHMAHLPRRSPLGRTSDIAGFSFGVVLRDDGQR